MPEKVNVSADALTHDAILGGRLHVDQPKRGFRVAIDSVLLPAAVPARAGESVLDLGCGVGAASLCLVRRVPECTVVGLELQPALVELARGNAIGNGLGGSFEAVLGDVGNPPERITQEKFFHVMMNPPYLEAGSGRAPKSASRAVSSIEADAPLSAWIASGARSLRLGGSLTVIHRADRLQDVLVALAREARDAGEIVVFPLWPESRRNPAIRVIVRARMGVATPLRIAPGLVLHESDGSFTREAELVLREARALEL
jgi:tRNA1(Val) A37 N6-methylase TrmN6